MTEETLETALKDMTITKKKNVLISPDTRVEVRSNQLGPPIKYVKLTDVPLKRQKKYIEE